MAKLYATEAVQRIVDQALQIRGSGLIAGGIMERLYRSCAARSESTTSEIHGVMLHGSY
jgi:alkylation response protein AidB-like acyl-CoA dehydrogenase